MNRTITDQIDQIEKPTCSARIEKIRLRLAILAPPASQASTSSASQCSMLRSRVIVVTFASQWKIPLKEVYGQSIPRRLLRRHRIVNTDSLDLPGCLRDGRNAPETFTP